MNYEQSLEYLLTRLPLFSRIGAAAYKEDLDNTIEICRRLGDPHKKFRSVHIAGTNGKGSVSHMLASIFQTAGYKTGLYSSPHLKDFRERIRIDGKMIDKDFVTDFTEKMKPAIDDIEPSFFELTVGMAFDYFAKEKVDIAIIETGLGGRLDSTNIITPELAVITNIGWDHMNLLGDSLEKIAKEKAGIIKAGIPAVIGEILPETKPVFESKAKSCNAQLTVAPDRFYALAWHWEKHELVVEVAEEHKTDHKVYHLDLPGLYQVKNLITVLETCFQLQQKGWEIDDRIIHTGLKQVKKLTGLQGRWDIIHQHPTIVLDVAHNEAGIKQVMEQVEVTDHHQLHIILGIVKDKDSSKILKLLPDTAKYYFTQAHIPRAVDSSDLAKEASSHGLKGKIYPDVNAAIHEAKSVAAKDDLILVVGSIFLVGEVVY